LNMLSLGMRPMTQSRVLSRAAHRAALLLASSAVAVMLAGPVSAKMRVDRLWLRTSAGQETPIDVEVAEAPKEKQVGLMFRTELPEGTGMLFPYGAPREITMWMHNTYIPLDMVFIRADGVVHRIEARAQPLSDRIIASQGPVAAVLELPGGEAERLGLKPGDHVRHPMFGAKSP
jgi:uncharacterized membrane protein (UPF0127 family)